MENKPAQDGRVTEEERLKPENWKLGVFYYNPRDKAFFVPKRMGFGGTFNLAHPLPAVLLVAAIIIIALALKAFGVSGAGINANVRLYVILAVIVAALAVYLFRWFLRR